MVNVKAVVLTLVEKKFVPVALRNVRPVVLAVPTRRFPVEVALRKVMPVEETVLMRRFPVDVALRKVSPVEETVVAVKESIVALAVLI